jgi:ADP-ribose pyrophosphatase
MVPVWVDLEGARRAVLTGRLHNPAAIVGILTAWSAREDGWSTLRPSDAPWPLHRAYR